MPEIPARDVQINNLKKVVSTYKHFTALGMMNKPRVINPNIDPAKLEEDANTFVRDGVTKTPIVNMQDFGDFVHRQLGRDPEDGTDFDYKLVYDAVFAVNAPLVAPPIVSVRRPEQGSTQNVRRALVPVWTSVKSWTSGEEPLCILACDMSRQDFQTQLTEQPTGFIRVTRTQMQSERLNAMDGFRASGNTLYGFNNMEKQRMSKLMESEQYGETVKLPDEIHLETWYKIDQIGVATYDLTTFGPSFTNEDFVKACKRYIDLFEKFCSTTKPLAWRRAAAKTEPKKG